MQTNIIVDNDNIVKLLFNPGVKFSTLHNLLFNNKKHKAILVYGGELRREYFRSNKVKKMIAQLERAGKAIYIKDDLVDSITEKLLKDNLCVSNDQHIVALSKISRVKLLCTNDSKLEMDFTNAKLLKKPRGKIYKNESHNHLLNI